MTGIAIRNAGALPESVREQLDAEVGTDWRKAGQPRKAKGLGNTSEGEVALLTRIKQLGLPEPVAQFKLPGVRGAYDFGWPDALLLVEVNGGIGTGYMSHSSYAGTTKNYLKYAAAAVLGYRLILLTTAQATSGAGALLIEAALNYVPDGSFSRARGVGKGET